MKRLSVSCLAPLMLAAVAVHATAAPSSRSGRVAVAPPLPVQSFLSSGQADCADRLFTNGLDEDSSGVCATDTVTVYTDRDAFLAALAPGHIENAFDNVAQGASGALRYSDGAFDYLIFTQPYPPGDSALYNGPGFVSTDRATDQIFVATFLHNAPITAMGGNMWPSDFWLQPTTGTIIVAAILQDGTLGATETIDTQGPDDFRGFVSTATPIAYLLIEAPDLDPSPPDDAPDRWPTLDNLIIGNAQ